MACCKRLENLLHDSGSKGITVAVKPIGDQLAFHLLSRVCDARDDEKLTQKIVEAKLLDAPKITVSAAIAIKYCPFCGTNLSVWANDNQKEVARYIETTSRYLPPSPF